MKALNKTVADLKSKIFNLEDANMKLRKQLVLSRHDAFTERKQEISREENTVQSGNMQALEEVSEASVQGEVFNMPNRG